MFERGKEKGIPIAIGVLFVLLLSLLLYATPEPFGKELDYLENGAYDLELKHTYKPVNKDLPITIIDIDDKSLEEQGRWPWTRKKLGELTESLFKLGAKVVAFDITFPEPEKNLADEVIEEVKHLGGPDSDAILSDLDKVRNSFDYDDFFAKKLALGDSILGFVFVKEGNSIGKLPFPLLTLEPEMEKEISIPDMNSFISNIPLLQSSAKGEAFINATPDSDGIIRFSPLLLRQGANVYSSLALEAARLFLDAYEFKLLTPTYGSAKVLEGIKLGQLTIPTDPWGRILIPFRGPPYSIRYVSATDVLKGRAPPDSISKKMIFIGSSATASGDVVATAIAPIFAGVEVHAQIASGILDNYFPYKPTWGKGVSVALVLFLGLICAFSLPFLGPIATSIVSFGLSALLLVANRWIWLHSGIVLSMIFPVLTVMNLYVLDIVCGYFFESRRRKRMKTIFGQYVPPGCIDSMMKKKGDFGLEGVTKELTVLFADIRNFTGLSEGLSANELKKLLNVYLTPMTQAIFDHQGTIDKYVGDMIMAFWGAPIDDPQNGINGVKAAFDMQKKLAEINSKFQKDKRPEIRIGIGINTGLMNVGDMGSKFRLAYTVLGDSVNLGSRLESLTKYYSVGIIAGESTQAKTKESIAYRKLDKVRVKGKEKGVEIFEPICELKGASPEIAARLEAHDRALEAYFHQKWDEAEKLFRDLRETDSNKALYDLYLSRIAKYKSSPPGAEWDGTTTLETK